MSYSRPREFYETIRMSSTLETEAGKNLIFLPVVHRVGSLHRERVEVLVVVDVDGLSWRRTSQRVRTFSHITTGSGSFTYSAIQAIENREMIREATALAVASASLL